ncbi:hypothetical protein T06_7123 [Trichinella sp. T6]|nr:hypothetical protein T06_7123 [Trichinella sp. T6]
MALVSHECETGLYLTKCRKEFIFVKQDLLENLPQRFLHRADVAFPTAAHPRGSPEKRCSKASASSAHLCYAPSVSVKRSADRPVAPSRYRASFRYDSWCSWIFAHQGQTSTLRAHWWPISTGGNLHWPTILATGWLISWPTRLCHMTWQGHLRTCSPKYPRRRAVQHHDAVSVHLHSVNGQKRLVF